MAIEILHITSHLNLADVSREVFTLLEISDFLEHSSENYPGGMYFSGTVNGVTVRLSTEDDRGYPDYQYSLVLKTSSQTDIDLEHEIADVAVKLLRAGYDVCRTLEDAEDYTLRLVYSLDESVGLAQRQERVGHQG